MQLDYLPDINEYGENILRLFDFDKSQAVQFRDLIQDIVINKAQKLDLSQVDFIKTHNFTLMLGIYTSDEGIISPDNITFYCALTRQGYEEMLEKIEPFCHKETKAYRFLYDIDNPTDFLFSPAGTK